ncbi:uncharacterized protein LOC144433404 [Glandiceps talaboti]
MLYYLISLVLISTCVHDVSCTDEGAANQTKTIRCARCLVSLDDEQSCLMNASIPVKIFETILTSVQCRGQCYMDKYTVGGKLTMYQRGCTADCEVDNGCEGLLKTGTCRRCCDGLPFCNVALSFGAASGVVFSVAVLIISVVLTFTASFFTFMI